MMLMCCVGALHGLSRGRLPFDLSRRAAAGVHRVPWIHPIRMVFFSLCLLSPTFLGIPATCSEPGQCPMLWMHGSMSLGYTGGLSHTRFVEEAVTTAPMFLVGHPLTKTFGVPVADRVDLCWAPPLGTAVCESLCVLGGVHVWVSVTVPVSGVEVPPMFPRADSHGVAISPHGMPRTEDPPAGSFIGTAIPRWLAPVFAEPPFAACVNILRAAIRVWRPVPARMAPR